tara:strand:- start:126 stop:809 length:684 start_codon:yes stop_codon:yes gene_type:complete
MGFLDHSTNNIIVDAVLTDVGRAALARNDGSFNIHQFALADDEVDYSIIRQFGRTVGKEKIELNTPVLEAVTQGNLGLKYPLVSVNNEFLTHLPTLTITTKDTPVTFSRTAPLLQSVQIEIAMQTGANLENSLIDGELFIEMSNKFISIVGDTPDLIFGDDIAVYRIATRANNKTGTVTCGFSLTQNTINQTTFNTYSTTSNNFIRTYVKVLGNNSGLAKTFEVQIS